MEDALRTVIDPEPGINVVDLGLVYRLEVTGGAVEVDLTMTTASCPLGKQILSEAQQAVAAVPGVAHAFVALVWDPAWGPERMSPAVRERRWRRHRPEWRSCRCAGPAGGAGGLCADGGAGRARPAGDRGSVGEPDGPRAGASWLGLGGAGLAAFGLPAAGPVYDALLHAVFVGLVFSMVFAHAPIILPAVARVAVPFHPVLYLPLALLHLGLDARVVGDLAPAPSLRRAGGLGNALAVALFFAEVRVARRAACTVT